MDEYGYSAEYAKSNRASCKKCKMGINKDSLRLAIMVQSPHFDGKVPNWHHPKCFWTRAKPAGTTDIHGFDALRWEDQEKIKKSLGGGGGGASGGDGPSMTVNDFTTEYAKSNRSSCRGCEEKIDKDVVRISKKDYEGERAKMYGPQDMWYHVDCFVADREELGFSDAVSVDKILGFGKLKKDDKDMLKAKLKSKGVKRKSGASKGPAAKQAKVEETPEEKTLKEQSKLIWTYRDLLQKEVSNNALKALLEYNGQGLPSGESKLLDRVSDVMVFGPLVPCPECKEGQLVYSSSQCYRCTGNLTSWTKCMYMTKTPKRKAFKVPKEFHDVEFLKKYKYTPRERVWPPSTEPAASASADDGASSSAPLRGVKLAVVGKLGRSSAAVKTLVEGLGGKISSKIDSSVAAVVSTKDELKKNSKKMTSAKVNGVHVVDEAFLDACSSATDVAALVTSHSIAGWGADPSTRIKSEVDSKAIVTKSLGKSLVSARDEKMFTKRVPDKLKMLVKGGVAVDPDSGLTASGHVLQVKGEPYNAILGMVDIVRGTNSFYKLQIIEIDGKNSWYLFRAWGRVGTTIGGNKLERKGSRESAMSDFEDLYAEKTGNLWEDRKSFVKHPNKFYPLEIDYGDEDEALGKLDMSGSKSKLAKSVQDLICRIFDIESMKKAMVEFELDLKKMPLGKLSRSQIEKAYKVLTELNKLIEKGGNMGQLVDASNRFYTLIPHDFGMKKPTILDAAELIKTKTEMLDNLLEIEVAYSMLKDAKKSGTVDPIDVHYQKLKTKIQPLERDSENWDVLMDYVKNTHAATHAQYDLEVLDMYEVARDGEFSRFKPFTELHNRMLLWHGSRTTNYAGILSQGLRIAPPEAPVTGYMFGKGLYFADMVSKSANYCRTSKSDPVGMLLLCDVALGNMHELTGAKYVTSLPKGKHSTKGKGMTTPDPKDHHTTKDGVVIPKGKGTKAPGGHSALLYNEYIVYDVAQVNIKYMLKVNFKWKW